MQTVYEFLDYKSSVSAAMQTKKTQYGRSFTFEAMAKAARIQKTYLSRVFHDDKTHLTADQLFLCCRYLGMNDDETRYLILLLERERSDRSERKDFLEEEIRAVREHHLRTESSLEDTNVYHGRENERLFEFYLNPELQLTHVALTIEACASDFKYLAKLLSMPLESVRHNVATLEKLGLVVSSKGKCTVKQPSLHLSKDSALYPAYRALMRTKLLARASQQQENDYAFSVMFSGTDETREAIQRAFLAFLKEAQHHVSTCAEPHQVYQMSFDLVNWSS
jgi:hypothetical protein